MDGCFSVPHRIIMHKSILVIHTPLRSLYLSLLFSMYGVDLLPPSSIITPMCVCARVSKSF